MNGSRCKGKEKGGEWSEGLRIQERSEGEGKREHIKQARRAGNETAWREHDDVHSQVFTLDLCVSGL